MRSIFPQEFSYYPRTWMLPGQLDDFKAHCAAAAGRRQVTFIVKPSSGCQGTGIYLIRTPEQLHAARSGGPPTGAVVQEYLDHPMLLGGLKFDFRSRAIGCVWLELARCRDWRGAMPSLGTPPRLTRPWPVPGSTYSCRRSDHSRFTCTARGWRGLRRRPTRRACSTRLLFAQRPKRLLSAQPLSARQASFLLSQIFSPLSRAFPTLTLPPLPATPCPPPSRRRRRRTCPTTSCT